jgi:Ribbon-helix-helix domain
MSKKPKPSLANSLFIKNLQEVNKKLILIDGEEESVERNTNEVAVNTLETDEQENVDVVSEVSSKSNESQEIVEEIKQSISKKRNNVPVYEDQYWLLNAISKVTDISITKLVREGLEMVIYKYLENFPEEIKSVQAMQKKMQITREAKK